MTEPNEIGNATILHIDLEHCIIYIINATNISDILKDMGFEPDPTHLQNSLKFYDPRNGFDSFPKDICKIMETGTVGAFSQTAPILFLAKEYPNILIEFLSGFYMIPEKSPEQNDSNESEDENIIVFPGNPSVH